MRNLVFLPLDFPIEVDVHAVLDYLTSHMEPFTKWWASSIIKRSSQSPARFENQIDSRFDFLRRYQNNENWVWEQDFKDRFPELITALENLPFRELTHCHLLAQSIDVEPHRDMPNNRTMGVSDEEAEKFNCLPGNFENEPILYKIMMGELPEKFFVCRDTLGNEKEFVKFPKNARAFLVPENTYYHGAHPEPHLKKIVCSLYGFVDYEKHQKLVKKSLEKYSEYAVWAETSSHPLPYHNDYCQSGRVRPPVFDDDFQPLPIFRQGH